MDTDGAVGRAGEVAGCCCGAEAVDRNICKREGFVAVYVCVSVLDGLCGCVCVCVCACEWRCPRDDAGIASALWWSQAARVPRGGGARWEHGGGARDEGVGAARDEGVQRFECERARVRARRRSSGVSQQHGGCEGSCCIAHYACTACMIWLLMYETQRTAATPGHGMEQAAQSRVRVCAGDGRWSNERTTTEHSNTERHDAADWRRCALPALF
jgi:hypothetical protein